MAPKYVIVGASLAGATAAITLREEGADGTVTLIGAEKEPPYERPPLSKAYLRGDVPFDKALGCVLNATSSSWASASNLQWRSSKAAVFRWTTAWLSTVRPAEQAALRPLAAA